MKSVTYRYVIKSQYNSYINNTVIQIYKIIQGGIHVQQNIKFVFSI
jgi:hypothetical protein